MNHNADNTNHPTEKITNETTGTEVRSEQAVPGGIFIKSEPVSPPRGASLLPPSSSLAPPPSLKTSTTIQKVARVRNGNQTIDLDVHSFGLYAYYAEGKTKEDHYDPYYGEPDVKDPALLERAKKYFESLRTAERDAVDEEYEMRSATLPTAGHKHLPMYTRKRKKIKKAVVLSKKVFIEPRLKQYLLSVYPLNHEPLKRWNLRTASCGSGYTSGFLMREEKFQEIVSQIRAGFEIPKPGPHSLKTDINLDSSNLSDNHSTSSIRHDLNGNCNGATVINFNCDVTIKQEPTDYEGPDIESCPANQFIKQEPVDVCMHIKKEPVSTNCTASSEQKRKKKRKKTVLPFLACKEEPVSDGESSSSLDASRTSHNNETRTSHNNETNTSHNNETNTSHNNETNTESPQIKQEPLDETQLKMVEIFRKRVHKLKKIEVLPMVSDIPEIKEEPVDTDTFSSTSSSPQHHKEFSLPSASKRAPKFVYGKRIRARMGFSRRRTLAVDAEVEFDQAAKISPPFSPPKICWSKKVPAKVKPLRQPKEKKRDALTLQIDQLITDGNIETLEETEQMYQLFAETIKSNTDRNANVFNIVLEKFKLLKKEKDTATESGNIPQLNSSIETENTSDTNENDKLKVIFPMDDHEIYGVTVIKETVDPGKFETPSIKKEIVDEETSDNTIHETTSNDNQVITDAKDGEDSVDETIINAEAQENPANKSFKSPTPPSISPRNTSDTTQCNPDASLVAQPEQKYSRSQIRPSHSQASSSFSLCRQDQPVVTCSKTPPPCNVAVSRGVYNGINKPYPTKSVKPSHVNPPTPLLSQQQYRGEVPSDAIPRQDSVLSSNLPNEPSKHGVPESERLFDEMIRDEIAHYPNTDTSYLEQYVRNDNVLSITALDDFIKGPLSSNEHLIKPKPSYGRMSYHSDDSFRGPHPSSLFPVRSDDMPNKDNQEWHMHWKKQSEAFDHFPNTSWPIEEQNSWNLSWGEPIFEQTTVSSNSSFEDLNDSRKFSLNFPIIERAPSGEEILKIPVNLRTVKTQFPLSDKKFSPIETSLPYVMYIPQRQDSVADIGIQTDGPPLKRHWTWLGQRPLSTYASNSVLVESMPKGANMAQSTSAQLNTSDESSDRVIISQRTIQTQYPGDKQGQFEFRECDNFFTCRNRQTKQSVCRGIQTDGQSLYPPWVAPGRFRRHRPVLIEPLPNIEPIGDNVRTMRSSDAYSILMEQIRTSNESSFDRFMNSQHQPNGITDSLNQHACYSPQTPNVRQLPLTVNQNYSKKSSAIGKGKRPGIQYKEVVPQPSPPPHSNIGLTDYQIAVKIRKLGQVNNIIGRLANTKRRSK